MPVSRTDKLQRTLAGRLVLTGLFLICALLYLPGLNSLFLFDDIPNLGALEYIAGLGPADQGFREFVSEGMSGPLGRPVSLFTFALQAEYWPDHPFPFKLFNLGIHLLNGWMVFLLANILARLTRASRRQCLWFSAMTAALWLLHPAHTATVLYTVQRMTLLSSTCILGALLAWLKLRIRWYANWKVPGLWCWAALCAGWIVLGMLSKENTVSVLFYVLALEYTLLARVRCNGLIAIARKLLWLPVLVLVTGFLFSYQDIQESFATRYDYGPIERLLTEARILWFYLLHTFLPGQGSTGLFIEFIPSRSLVQPAVTLPSVLGWLVLTVGALCYRKRFPVAAFALFWFFAAHMIESTVLPLELFFNHRNYLGMIGPLFLFIRGLGSVSDILGNQLNPRLVKSLPVMVLVLFALQLGLTTRLWSSPLELASVWVTAHPDTPRNEQFFANQLAQNGRLEEAMAVYEDIIERDAGPLWPQLNFLILSCYSTAPVSINRASLLEYVARPRQSERSLMTPLRQLNDLVVNDQCSTASQIPLDEILALLEPSLSEEDQGFVRYELSRLALRAGNTEEALTLMQQAYALSKDVGILFVQANVLINLEREREALELVDEGLYQLQFHNNIETGTRAMKEDTLLSMRRYLTGEE